MKDNQRKAMFARMGKDYHAMNRDVGIRAEHTLPDTPANRKVWLQNSRRLDIEGIDAHMVRNLPKKDVVEKADAIYETGTYGDATTRPSGVMTIRSEEVPANRKDNIRVKMYKTRLDATTHIKQPEDVHTYLKEMEDYDREYAKLLHLDTKNGVIGVETVSVGTLNSGIVHPRELMKGAILNNSASVIFVHNHPSGDPTPSKEDVAVTKRLSYSFKEIGIDLLDSIVIGRGRFISLKDEGKL